MKKLLKTLLTLSAVCAVAYSCNDNNSGGGDDPVPSPTTLAFSNVTANTATLTWTGSGESYEISVDGQTKTTTQPTYTAEGLNPDTQYQWSVRAKVGDRFSAPAKGPEFKTLQGTGNPPSEPSNLTASSLTSTGVRLSWQGEAESFEVMLLQATRTTSDNFITYNDLTPSTAYTWQVRAKSGDYYSSWVTGSGFTTPAPSAEPTVSVTFGDVSWTAGYTEILRVTGAAPFMFFGIAEDFDEDYPMLSFTSGIVSGTYQFDGDSDDEAEYYESTYLEDEDTGYIYGDWCHEEGSVTITVTGNLVSGELQSTMFNAYEELIEENPNPEIRTLNVKFENLDIEDFQEVIAKLTALNVPRPKSYDLFIKGRVNNRPINKLNSFRAGK